MMIAVILMGLLTSLLLLEAEKLIFLECVFAIPDTELQIAVENFPHRLAMECFFGGSLHLVEPVYVEKPLS
jgi:hypothetical protein